jgi:alkylation response protein AidB-like acyl-CoA dehydrogenase
MTVESMAGIYEVPQEMRDFRETIAKIVDERIRPRAAEIDQTGEYPWDVRRLLAEHDILALPFPTEYGGTGTGTLMLQIAVEEIAKACASSALILMVQELGSLPIQLFGTDDQKQRWLPSLASGEKSPAFALSEPEAGSDPASMRTTAVKDGDEWVINGQKNWITNATVADFYVVFAKTDRETNRITAFVVEADRDGFDPRQARAQARYPRLADGPADVHRSPRPGGQRHRRGRPRPVGRAGDARAHAPRRRGAGRRDRAGRPRLRDRLRQREDRLR